MKMEDVESWLSYYFGYPAEIYSYYMKGNRIYADDGEIEPRFFIHGPFIKHQYIQDCSDVCKENLRIMEAAGFLFSVNHPDMQLTFSDIAASCPETEIICPLDFPYIPGKNFSWSCEKHGDLKTQ